jgi:hypothetical protein
MKNNWEQLPATLRRRKEKLSQAVLDQFTEDVTPGEDEIQLDLNTNLDKENKSIQKVADDSIHPAFLEELQLSPDKNSTELLVLEQDSASVNSLRMSSTPSQIIVRPQIHRECSDSSLECVENTTGGLNFVSSNNDQLVESSHLEARDKRETDVEAETEIKIQTHISEEDNKNNTEKHGSAQTETQFKEKTVTQLGKTTEENAYLTTVSSEEVVLKNGSLEENTVDSFSDLKGDGRFSALNKNYNFTNSNENSNNKCDKNEIDISCLEKSEVPDSKRSAEYDSEKKIEFKESFLPSELYMFNSSHKDKNKSVHCETPPSPNNLKLPATKEVNQEASRASTSLSHEEQHVMALLSRAVSEDSLLVPSSPSSTSVSSVTSSIDERNHDSGTDVNSPLQSTHTPSSNVEPVSTSTSRVITDTTSHYKNPKNVLKSVENIYEENKVNPDEILQTSVTASHDIGATDSGIEKSFGSQSTESSPSSPISRNNGKSPKISKHNDKNLNKYRVNDASSARAQPSSSSSNCCFPSLSDDPTLYEVVIPRAEYHKPSPIALKTAEYQVPKDKLLHEINHDVLGSATLLTKDKLACSDRSKTNYQPTKSPVKMESLGRDEEDVMSYYDAVVQEGQISNIQDFGDKDISGHYSMHPKSRKALVDDKDYEYVARGLYINDYVHAELKNQKSVCNGRIEDGHVDARNAIAKRYAAMEFVSGFAKPVDNSAVTCTDLNKCCKDKICCDKDKWLLDTSVSKWKKTFGLETLNKKPVTMATIMEEREGETDASATTVNTSDSEKLTVREILRRFEELGGRVQLPTDIMQVDGDSEIEKSATLREIQETLRCIEEKVRHYDTKAATTQTQDLDENSSCEKVEYRHMPLIDTEVY